MDEKTTFTTVCDECGEECEPIRRPYSESFEFWGERGVYRGVELISDCCGAGAREKVTQYWWEK